MEQSQIRRFAVAGDPLVDAHPTGKLVSRFVESSVPLTRISLRRLVIAAAVLSIVFTFHANAQTGGHLIVSKMVDKPNGQFAFEPSTIAAQHGDTVRFVQSSIAPHNVHFTKTPKGAKLGKASTGPYVIGAGKTYDLVIDSRFPDGSYEFVCDPHQGVGMQGVLTVASSVK
jgi:plastocyanin